MNEIQVSPPQIKVKDAISFAGNQSRLARLLGIKRSSVNEWIKSNREFIPPLQAFKLAEAFPEFKAE